MSNVNQTLNHVTENSKKYTNQLHITKNLPASSTSGSLVNLGISSIKDINVSGDYAINDIKITPNKQDIIRERYFTLENNISTWSDISQLKFSDSITKSFLATINISVETESDYKSCILYINAIKKDTWKYTSNFSGDITGVNIRISDKEIDNTNYCQFQYLNENSLGTTKISIIANTMSNEILYENNSGIITNSFTNGNLNTNSFLNINESGDLVSSILKYENDNVSLGTSTNLLLTNTSEFKNFTSGSGLIISGDMNINKNLIINESGSLSINTTKTSANLNLGYGNSLNIIGDIKKEEQVIINTNGYANFDSLEVNGDGIKLLTPYYTSDYSQIGVDENDNLFFNNTAGRNPIYQGMKFQTGYSHSIKTKLQLINYNGNPRVNIGGHDSFTHTLSLSKDSAAQPTSNVWITSSDSRLKTDIELANLDLCTENIMNLPLKRWSWKDDYLVNNKIYDKNALGLIAQDVENIFPKSVHYDIINNEPAQIDTTGNYEIFINENGDTVANTMLSEEEKQFIQDEYEYIKNQESYTQSSLKTVNSDQIFWSLYGTVQKLIENVEYIKNNV